MISPLPCSNNHAVVLAGAYISPDSDLDRDTQILATLLKLIPGCIDAADIELLLQGIPVQPPVVIPARSITVYAGGNTGRKNATTGRGCCQHLLQERTHYSGARPSTRYQRNCSERPYTKGHSPSRFQCK